MGATASLYDFPLDRSGMYQTTFKGFKVYINPALDTSPKMQLSPEIVRILSPHNSQFVNEMNDWLLKRFGTEAQVIFSHDLGCYIVGPKTYQQMLKLNLNAQ